jgi:hypothetical protein
VKKILLILTLALIVVAIPLGVASAAGNSKTWYLDQVAHPAVADCLKMSLTAPTSNGNVEFSNNKGMEHTWLTDQAAQASVSFPAGDWEIVLKTGEDWGTIGSELDIKLGYWDTSFHPFGDQNPVITRPGNGLTDVTITITTTSHTLQAGDYLALWIKNTGTKPHHINTGAGLSAVNTPPNDPGYPLPEWTSGVLMGLGLAGLGSYVVLRRRSRKAARALV